MGKEPSGCILLTYKIKNCCCLKVPLMWISAMTNKGSTPSHKYISNNNMRELVQCCSSNLCTIIWQYTLVESFKKMLDFCQNSFSCYLNFSKLYFKDYMTLLFLHHINSQLHPYKENVVLTLKFYYLQKLQVPSKQHFLCCWSCVFEYHRLYQSHRFLELYPQLPRVNCQRRKRILNHFFFFNPNNYHSNIGDDLRLCISGLCFIIWEIKKVVCV